MAVLARSGDRARACHPGAQAGLRPRGRPDVIATVAGPVRVEREGTAVAETRHTVSSAGRSSPIRVARSPAVQMHGVIAPGAQASQQSSAQHPSSPMILALLWHDPGHDRSWHTSPL
jgi:hypothetical protein